MNISLWCREGSSTPAASHRSTHTNLCTGTPHTNATLHLPHYMSDAVISEAMLIVLEGERGDLRAMVTLGSPPWPPDLCWIITHTTTPNKTPNSSTPNPSPAMSPEGKTSGSLYYKLTLHCTLTLNCLLHNANDQVNQGTETHLSRSLCQW